MYENHSEKGVSSTGQNGEKIEIWFNLKVNELYYFDGCYHFLLTKQKIWLLLHFPKFSGFSIEIVLLVHFITTSLRVRGENGN